MPKLEIELIPKTCHYKNARKKLKASQWDTIRKYAYEKADFKCEICGLGGHEQGFKNNLECHEVWQYDLKTLTQKLIGVMAICTLCHQTKHFARASHMGKQAEVFAQLQKINKWSHKQAVQHLGRCFLECKIRGQFKWKLDISILFAKPFNLTLQRKARKKRKRARA